MVTTIKRRHYNKYNYSHKINNNNDPRAGVREAQRRPRVRFGRAPGPRTDGGRGRVPADLLRGGGPNAHWRVLHVAWCLLHVA